MASPWRRLIIVCLNRNGVSGDKLFKAPKAIFSYPTLNHHISSQENV